MEPEFETSHRYSKAKFVKIEARHRVNNSRAIITCEADDMAKNVKSIESRGYKIHNIVKM